jgi:hypothetical protein
MPSARRDKKEKPSSKPEETNGETRLKNTTRPINNTRLTSLPKKERPEILETSTSLLKLRLPLLSELRVLTRSTLRSKKSFNFSD